MLLALDNISEHYFENEAMIAWWNDWKARDQRAKIEKTFNHGRFSREKRTLGKIHLFEDLIYCPCVVTTAKDIHIYASWLHFNGPSNLWL